MPSWGRKRGSRKEVHLRTLLAEKHSPECWIGQADSSSSAEWQGERPDLFTSMAPWQDVKCSRSIIVISVLGCVVWDTSA